MGRDSTDDLARLLAKAEGLGPPSYERALWLARIVPEMNFVSGQTIYGPTRDSPIMYVLLEGRVRLYMALDGDEITLEVVEAGQLFADVPTMAGRPRGAYAQALAPARVVLLSPAVMRQLVYETPEVGIRMVQRLSERLYEYQQRMADVALKQVPARLASLLLRLFETEGVVDREGARIGTRYTHEQFAAMIGAKRVP